jgi:hypothetical protein
LWKLVFIITPPARCISRPSLYAAVSNERYIRRFITRVVNMFVGVRTDGGEVLYPSNSVELPSARADWITARRLPQEQARACSSRVPGIGRLSAGRT